MAAKNLGADLIGFVFAESKRRIAVPAAVNIARKVAGIGKVGVFVDQPLAVVQEIAELCGLDYVQLHGKETPEYCRQIKTPVIKALRVDDHFNPALLKDYQVDWLLLDSFVPGQVGGTGVAFDWRQTREAVGQIKTRFLLAGGLTQSNVTEAIRVLQPGGVDVSGGVESDGRKDVEKIGRFISAVKMAQGDENVCSTRL